jgi:hypothetical protein
MEILNLTCNCIWKNFVQQSKITVAVNNVQLFIFMSWSRQVVAVHGADADFDLNVCRVSPTS